MHGSQTPTYGGKGVHAVPPLESGMACRPMHDSKTPTFGGKGVCADPPPDLGPEDGFLPHLESEMIHTPEHVLMECPLTEPLRARSGTFSSE